MQDFKKKRPKERRPLGRKPLRPAAPPTTRVVTAGLEPLPPPPSRPIDLGRGLAGLGWGRLWPSPRFLFALASLWLVAGMAYGAARAWQAPLTDLEITGLETLTPVSVAVAAGLYPGVAVGQVEPLGTAERVLRLPRVRGVEVRRGFPGHLSIAVEERRGLALALLADGSSALIDSDGIVLETQLPGEEVRRSPLPRIQSAARAAVAGERLEDPAVARGMAVLADAAGLGMELRGRLEVNARRPYMTTVSFPDRGHAVLLPGRETRRALALYLRLRPLLEAGALRVATVDLRAALREGSGWVALRR